MTGGSACRGPADAPWIHTTIGRPVSPATAIPRSMPVMGVTPVSTYEPAVAFTCTPRWPTPLAVVTTPSHL